MTLRLAHGLAALSLGALAPSLAAVGPHVAPHALPTARAAIDENAEADSVESIAQDPGAPAPSTETPAAADPASPTPATKSGEEPDSAIQDGKVVVDGIEFQMGPCTGKLGAEAELVVPEGLLFTDGDGARRVLEMSQNLTSGTELGMVSATDFSWQVFFQYDASGYVKDDEKDNLDADAALENYKEGIAAGNEERERRGWGKLELVGWHKPPFYDPKTNNLTWSLLIRSGDHQNVNWSTRLLGRGGIMNVDLVLSPEKVDAVLPEFEKLIEGFHYVPGKTYGEFRSGDKIAEYGLAALVAGGAGAVAFKTGLLAKFWKFIVGGIVAIAALFKRMFGFGKKDGESNASS